MIKHLFYGKKIVTLLLSTICLSLILQSLPSPSLAEEGGSRGGVPGKTGNAGTRLEIN